jgi:hypothetical protein
MALAALSSEDLTGQEGNNMAYVYEQMTMDDIHRVIEDAAWPDPAKKTRLTGTRGTFRGVLDAPEEDQEMLAAISWCWAIDREKGYYIIRRPFLPEHWYFIFYFRNVTYFVSVNRYGTKSFLDGIAFDPVPPGDLMEEFLHEFAEGGKICKPGYPHHRPENLTKEKEERQKQWIQKKWLITETSHKE